MFSQTTVSNVLHMHGAPAAGGWHPPRQFCPAGAGGGRLWNAQWPDQQGWRLGGWLPCLPAGGPSRCCHDDTCSTCSHFQQAAGPHQQLSTGLPHQSWVASTISNVRTCACRPRAQSQSRRATAGSACWPATFTCTLGARPSWPPTWWTHATRCLPGPLSSRLVLCPRAGNPTCSASHGSGLPSAGSLGPAGSAGGG